MSKREVNLAKYGPNHAKEAQGLAIARDAFAHDGRLCFKRSAEGARADFVVWLPGREDHALGVQLKTCHTANFQSKRRRVCFGETQGYDGLLVMLVSFLDHTPRVWLLSGKDVGEQQSLCFGDTYLSTEGGPGVKWQRREVPLPSLPQRFVNALQLGNIVDLHLEPAERLVRPPRGTRLTEYEAHEWLRERLPMRLEAPDVEQLPYDYMVEGAKWQLKVACYVSRNDSYSTGLHKKASVTIKQYQAGDFDWLAVQLPLVDSRLSGVPARLYLIPFSELAARGLVGRNVTSAALYLYPHRLFREHREGTYGLGVHWTEAFVVDLSSPLAALTGYLRLKGGVA